MSVSGAVDFLLHLDEQRAEAERARAPPRMQGGTPRMLSHGRERNRRARACVRAVRRRLVLFCYLLFIYLLQY